MYTDRVGRDSDIHGIEEYEWKNVEGDIITLG
jgi:hypothetical protein